MSKLSNHGNAHLRCVFWMAGTVAIRMRENTFRKKYENYIKADPGNPDLKRKAYTAVAAKMARVAYGLIKSERDYRCYYESSIPKGNCHSNRVLIGQNKQRGIVLTGEWEQAEKK
jgi:hypothetical protein